MRKDLLIIALGLFATTAASAQPRSDVLSVPETEPTAAPAPMTMPAKGSSMVDVEKKFGEPRAKQPPAGGDTPKHPPITRWDYEGFRVFFEHDKVIDTVIPGAPPRVHHKEELTPVAGAEAPPMPETTPAQQAAPAEPPPDETGGMIPEAPTGTPNEATPENPNPDAPPPQ